MRDAPEGLTVLVWIADGAPGVPAGPYRAVCAMGIWWGCAPGALYAFPTEVQPVAWLDLADLHTPTV
jgi:hypothetical protein